MEKNFIRSRSSSFDHDSISEGYYDLIYRKNKGVRSKWHHLKFKGVMNMIDKINYKNILDIGCGSGTFLGNILVKKNCIGIDISKK
jgi:2-polyprenyl-3-methyl-5-hydroxy-6-metoxy-1,4-benzoquinol methylase